MSLILRRADLSDAPTLVALGRETFIEAFGPLYPQADLDAFLAEAYDLDSGRRATLVECTLAP